ncbi:MAG: TAXI family TRAP transporter solute-binding subunit [Chloroflexota bacterium]
MKRLYVFLSALMVLILVLGTFGCAKPAPAPSPTPPRVPAPAPVPSPSPTATPAPAPSPSAKPTVGGKLLETFIVGASGVGKGYTLGAVYSELINKKSTTMKSVVNNVPGSALKARQVADGKIHTFILSVSDPWDIYTGGRGWEQVKLRNLTSSGMPASTVFMGYTRPDTGIKTLKDMKGKKVYAAYTGNPWMGDFVEAAIAANGMTTKDMTWLKFSSSDEAFREVKERRADVVFYPSGAGSLELSQTVGIWAIPLTPAEQASVAKALPAFTPFVAPKGHEGITADTPAMKSDMCYWVSDTLSDISAYTAVKLLYENLDDYYAAYPAAKGFTLKDALNVWAIPYHPGSIAYFKEKGIWGAAEDKKQEELLEKEKTIFKK